MRRIVMVVAVLGAMFGATAPAHAETAHRATYAVATTSSAQFDLYYDVFGTVLCHSGFATTCPNPESFLPHAQEAADPKADWAPSQATGAPDTPVCGDIGTAWSPLLNGHEAEIVYPASIAEPNLLGLTYNPPVDHATRVDIYETNEVGFVTQVDVLLVDGSSFIAFDGADPTTACPGVLSVPLMTSLPVAGVLVHTANVGYEEVDAVGVVS